MVASALSHDPFTLLRPTVMDVDLDALVANYRAIQAYVKPARVMPILKAEAYGHGLVVCARVLEEAGADFFGVAFLEEALELREAGIKARILALGGICGRQLAAFVANDVEITASSVTKLEAVEELARTMGKKAKVHLKIDTGMERIGVHYYSAESLLTKSLSCTHCEVAGIFSHFATSESPDTHFTELQLERFLESCHFFEKRSLPTPMRHIANSGGILQHTGSHLDIVRPGLILYGVHPAEHLRGHMKLEPVMSLRSEVVYFKVVQQGAGVSYDLTWHAPEQTRVVTIPMGYGDGYPRNLSNRAQVLIRGNRFPIVGKICMDQCMVNIGPNGEAYNGDEVVLLGGQGQERIDVEELARLAETDLRDVLLRLALRAPKRFHRDGSVFLT